MNKFKGFIFTMILGICLFSVDSHAQIAYTDAFEDADWEMIIEDRVESPTGVVQSMCATDQYIVCIENTVDLTENADIVRAYYRYDTDAEGNPVEQYSLAKRVEETNYEHANGMAYNPNTNEIAVSLYTDVNPENRGCIFLMDADTLTFKERVKITDDCNILGIGYDSVRDQYVVQTNDEGGYSFWILNNQFQIIEDLGTYEGTATNFQDLCVTGDYILTFPLAMSDKSGDYIMAFSLITGEWLTDSQVDWEFESVDFDEPESITELEDGIFITVDNMTFEDGSRDFCIYKTMVPYDFPVTPGLTMDEDNGLDLEEAVQEKGIHVVTSSISFSVRLLIILFAGLFCFFIWCGFYLHLKMVRQRKHQTELRKREKARRRAEEIEKDLLE